MKATKSYKVHIDQGEHDGALNRQWMSRPDDQRFISLDDLSAMVNSRRDRSFSNVIKVRDIRAEVTGEDETLGMALHAALDTGDRYLVPTNWGFQQLCSRIGVGPKFLTDIPADLAVPVINHYLDRHGEDQVKIFGELVGDTALFKAANSPTYGRIFDRLLVNAVGELVKADPKWKIPGTMNWGTSEHNPNIAVNKQNTTLFGSDRDIWLFFCQDANPVQAGVLSNGEPDWYFPGFYAWNSEVGASTLGVATFWLRAVCENRNLWGVQDKMTVKIKHSRWALDRFVDEVEPILNALINERSSEFVTAVENARRKNVAKDDEDRHTFLKRHGFPKRQRLQIIDAVYTEEHEPLTTVYHAVQGITAVARDIPYQDQRLEMEQKAELVLLSAS